jgi:hypothetical protein
LTNGLPIAFGATDLAIRPASTTTVTTYGNHLDQRARDAAHDRQVDAFDLDLHRAEEAEHQAAQHRVQRTPVAEHQAVSAR